MAGSLSLVSFGKHYLIHRVGRHTGDQENQVTLALLPHLVLLPGDDDYDVAWAEGVRLAIHTYATSALQDIVDLLWYGTQSRRLSDSDCPSWADSISGYTWQANLERSIWR